MEWQPSGDMNPAPDQDSGGDIEMISSDPADNTQADHTQQTETVVPKKRQISVPMDERPSEPDPFGQVFSGPDYTKHPAADLLRPQNHQLDMICDLGYAPKVGEAGPGFFGAAYSSLLLFNISPFRGRLTEFFDWAVERLADAAEASRDLAEFIHALNPNITCTKTEAGWEIYYGGVIRMHWGARPIDVTHYVERFISRAEDDWISAEAEEAQCEEDEAEDRWEEQNAYEH